MMQYWLLWKKRERPAYNGPNFNRPDVFCRWPWQDELDSGDPEQLIGGREFLDDTFDLALQYRDVGRWFTLHYKMIGYADPRLPDRSYGPPLLERGTFPLDAYPDLEILKGIGGEFFSLCDFNDPETTAFAKRAHALWRRIATKNVSVYDPIEQEIVTPEGWHGSFHTPVGKRALEHGLEKPPRYAGFAFSVSEGRRKGPALMIGPKPRKSRSTKIPK